VRVVSLVTETVRMCYGVLGFGKCCFDGMFVFVCLCRLCSVFRDSDVGCGLWCVVFVDGYMKSSLSFSILAYEFDAREKIRLFCVQ
jgi:hypothetical protein